MNRACRFLTTLLAFLAWSTGFAQTTGSIGGTITDESGQALPGVTVTAESPSLQGIATTVSGGDGGFRLLFLPPGAYAVHASLAGFSPVDQRDVEVQLGRSVTLHVTMQTAFEEALAVTAVAPAIDVTTSEVGFNFAKGFFLQLPIQRNYASVVAVAPGTSQDGAGTMVYGSSGAENAYYIDGANTTGIVYGVQGKELNFEFIEEVQVRTGGYQAEFGRATGGVVNVITRAGGNEFHGDAFAYYFGDELQSSPKQKIEEYRRENRGTYVDEAFTEGDWGADLGGYLQRDKLWFFAAYDRVNNDTDRKVAKDFTPYDGPPVGKVYVVSRTRDLWSAKLTWRLSQNHSLIASGFGDPTHDDGPLPFTNIAGPESTFLGALETGGNDATLKYQGVMGSSLVVEAQAARHREQLVIDGPGAGITRINDFTTPLYALTNQPTRSGGFGGFTNQQYARDVYRADASYFVSGFGGSHELKLGAEYEDIGMDSALTYSGGQVVAKRCARGHLTLDGCNPEWVFYTHGLRLGSAPPGGLLDPDLADYIHNPIVVNRSITNRGAYLQDAWRPLPNLTVNLGLRWEGQRLYGRDREAKVVINDNWAPRLGAVWDWTGEGRAKLFGSWGRFYETIPGDMALRAFTGDVVVSVTNRDPVEISCDPELSADPNYLRCRGFGGYIEPVDPDIKGQYMDELVLGAELEVAANLVVGAKAIYRALGRVIEDGLTITGDYAIGNPGRGLMSDSVDESYSYLIPTPEAKRFFRGIELTARKRFSDRWQAVASYLYSTLEGNYDGNFQGSNGQLDPNLASAYDYAEFQIHNRGDLSSDRRHQLKAGASYLFSFGLDVGITAFYQSGVPVTAMGADNNYGPQEYFLSNRGAWDRTAPEYEMELHFGYALHLRAVEINLLLDVFNLLNRQGETGRDTRYDLYQVFDVIDYETGEVLAPIRRGTTCDSLVPEAYAIYCNPAFNTANAWQDPRSVRLGVRVTF